MEFGWLSMFVGGLVLGLWVGSFATAWYIWGVVEKVERTVVVRMGTVVVEEDGSRHKS